MNDFTKEELGIIYCNLAVNDKTKDVLCRITNMYENYCEHESEPLPQEVCCVKCQRTLV